MQAIQPLKAELKKDRTIVAEEGGPMRPAQNEQPILALGANGHKGCKQRPRAHLRARQTGMCIDRVLRVLAGMA
jgi:hypothetical protein